MYLGVSHAAAVDTQFLPWASSRVGMEGPDPELFALKVLVGEGGHEPELFALKVLVCLSCCWSGTASLYRPGISTGLQAYLERRIFIGRRVTYNPGRRVHCRPPR